MEILGWIGPIVDAISGPHCAAADLVIQQQQSRGIRIELGDCNPESLTSIVTFPAISLAQNTASSVSARDLQGSHR